MAAPAALVVFVAVLHPDLFALEVPATGDHMIHLYQAWHTGEHLLSSGRLTGYSHMAFVGYPAGVFYPVLGDLLVLGLRLVALGLPSWEQAYAALLALLVLAIPVTVYATARRFASQAASLFAAVLCAGDVGRWPEGGHHSTIYWGVWPFILGALLTVHALLALERRLGGTPPSRWWRGIALPGVLLGLALLAHPMSLVYLALALPALALTAFIREKAWGKPLQIIGSIGLPALIGFALAAFWLIPWLLYGGEWTFKAPTEGFGGAWLSFGEIAEGLATGDIFENFYTGSWVAGLLGIASALVFRRRSMPLVLVAILAACALFAGTFEALGDNFVTRRIQLARLAVLMKLCWFPLAALAVDEAYEGAKGLAKRLGRNGAADVLSRPPVRICAAMAITAALVIAGWSEHYSKIPEVGVRGGPLWESIVAAEEWLGAEPDKGPLERVLYQPGPLCLEPGRCSRDEKIEIYHRHIFASGPMRTGRPKLRLGYEACAIFSGLPLVHRWSKDEPLIRAMLQSPAALERLGVHWIISLAPFVDRDDLRLAKRFGDVYVYETSTDPDQPAILEGPGEAKLLRWSPEHIAVEVTGAFDGSRLVLPAAYFPLWRAYRENHPIEIQKVPAIQGGPEFLIAVPAGNGRIDFVYERALPERAAGWMSALAWLAVAISAGIGARRRIKKRRA